MRIINRCIRMIVNNRMCCMCSCWNISRSCRDMRFRSMVGSMRVGIRIGMCMRVFILLVSTCVIL